MPRRKLPPPIPDPQDLPPGTRGYRYVRDSGGAKQEKSVPEQIEELDRKWNERGWVDAGTFVDLAKSGSDPGREGFNDLLSALRERRDPDAQVVGIWAYRRLAREEGLGFELLAASYRAGVALDSISDPVPAEFRAIMEPLKLWQAAEESRRMGADIKRGQATLMRQGYAPGGTPPLGYTVEHFVAGTHRDGTPRKWPRWIKDPQTRDRVGLAWQMNLEHAGYPAILKIGEGLFGGVGTLAGLFRNPAYCGFPRWYLNFEGGAVVDCASRDPICEPYVSVADWLRINEREQENPRRAFGGWPLSGLAVCGYCGGTIVAWGYRRRCDLCGTPWAHEHLTCPGCGADYSHRGGPYRYVCNLHHLKRECPESQYMSGLKLDRLLLHEIARHLTPDRMIEAVRGTNQALQAVQASANQKHSELVDRLQVAQQGVGRLLETIEAAGPSAAVIGRLQEREQEVTALKSEMVRLPQVEDLIINPEDAVAWAEFFVEDVNRMRRPDVARLYRALNLRATLYRDQVAASIDWPPLSLLLPLNKCAESFVPLEGTLADSTHLFGRIEFLVPLPKLWVA